MDADMAKEIMEYARNSILVQAAQAMLAQSNQNAAWFLSLLK
ncbi:flagellin [Anaerovibrio sp.]